MISISSKRRERIIEKLSAGQTNRQIADSLCISTNTVKYHLKVIFDYYGVTNRTELASKYNSNILEEEN